MCGVLFDVVPASISGSFLMGTDRLSCVFFGGGRVQGDSMAATHILCSLRCTCCPPNPWYSFLYERLRSCAPARARLRDPPSSRTGVCVSSPRLTRRQGTRSPERGGGRSKAAQNREQNPSPDPWAMPAGPPWLPPARPGAPAAPQEVDVAGWRQPGRPRPRARGSFPTAPAPEMRTYRGS